MTVLWDPLTVIYWAAGLLAVMTLLSLLHGKKFTDAEKKLFFALIAIPTILATVYVAGFTVYENTISETGGPIHWHIDYQVHVCGERLDLIDPNFPSNKIGTPLFHEHNDDRLHVEGTVMDLDDIDLGSYFDVLGGRLTDSNLVFPTNDGRIVDVSDGDLCNGQASTLKVYVNGERINNPAEYLYYPHPLVPPGDCAIIEFSPSDSETTDVVCESWQSQGWNYDNYKDKRAQYDEDIDFHPEDTHEHTHGEEQ